MLDEFTGLTSSLRLFLSVIDLSWVVNLFLFVVSQCLLLLDSQITLTEVSPCLHLISIYSRFLPLFFPMISSPGGDSSAGFETVTYMLEVVILSID